MVFECSTKLVHLPLELSADVLSPIVERFEEIPFSHRRKYWKGILQAHAKRELTGDSLKLGFIFGW
jgi:hypothetical protein